SRGHLRNVAFPGKWCCGGPKIATFFSPTAGPGLFTPILVGSSMPRAWRIVCGGYRGAGNKVCFFGLSTWSCLGAPAGIVSWGGGQNSKKAGGREERKGLLRWRAAAGFVVGWPLPALPPTAQRAAPAAPQLKPGTPAAMAAAREILALRNASAMFAN